MKDTSQDKIVLVSPGPQRLQFGPIAHLPLALLSLAAWIQEKADYRNSLRIIDNQIRPLTEEDVRDAAVVGITAMTGYQIKYGLDVARLVRKTNPAAVIVWGGVHASLLPEQTASDPFVDLVVIGEGEQTLLDVIDAIFLGKPLEKIPGTCVQTPTGEFIFGEKRDFMDLDDLPLPAYDLINMADYKGIHHQFDYQSSRGCPFRCSFCYNTVFCGRRYRKKSAAKVVNELIHLYDTYKITDFGFVDDEFFIEKKRVEAIMDSVIASNRHFGIIASCRLDVVCGFPDTLLKKMKQCGVQQIFFGAESGSYHMLKDIKKDINREQIIEGAKRVAEAGIRPILSFMSGFPGERLEDLEETLDLIRVLWKIHPLITVNGIFPFNAYPGTTLYKRSLELGLVPPSSLKEWGDWSFQYTPDNPWLNDKAKRYMQIAFYMVRFKYYTLRFQDRHRNKLSGKFMKLLTWPLEVSVNLRLKKRWFFCAWEWHLFAFLIRKTFGYL